MEVEALADRTFGPVQFTQTKSGVEAVLDGQAITVQADGDAVALSAQAPIDWPDTAPVPEEDRLIASARRALRGLGHVTDVSSVGEDGVSVTLYVEGEGIGEIAQAVQATRDALEVVREACLAAAHRAETEAQLDELIAQTEPGDGPPDAAEDVWGEVFSASTPPQPEAQTWVYVMQPTEVLHPDGGQQVVGTLVPGSWYAFVEARDGWAFVRDPNGSMEGWVPEGNLHVQEGT